MRIQAQLEY